MFRARVFGLGGFEKDFAIRKLPAGLCSDEPFLQRFITAANAAARLHGERIARVQEVDAEDGIYYVVSDLARGVELGALPRLSRPAALCVVMDVCDALVYAHGRRDLLPGGVLHLGLCPRSIVIGAEGELRVVDLGLVGALVQPGWTERHDLQSRLGYLAPEVVAGAGAGPQADVYSLGAILQELTGGAPDEPDLHRVIITALSSDPTSRPQTALRLRDLLAPFVGDRVEARRQLATEVVRFQFPESGSVPMGQLVPKSSLSDEPMTPPPLDFDGPLPLAPPPPLPPTPRTELVWGPEDRAESAAPPLPSPSTSTSTTTSTTTTPPVATAGPDAETRQVDVTPLAPVRTIVTRPGESAVMRERGRVPTPIATPAPIPSPPTLSLAALRGLKWPWTRIAAAGGVVVLVAAGTLIWHRAFHRVAMPQAPQAMSLPVRSLVGRVSTSEARASGTAVPASRPVTDIRSNPAGAHVFVDGALRGTTPLSAELPPGVHRVVVVHDHYKVWSRSTNDTEIAAALEPAELPESVVGHYGLKIRCHTADLLRILIDGVDTGIDCPNQDKLELAGGRHQISLYNPLTDETVHVQRDVVLSGTERSRRVYLKY